MLVDQNQRVAVTDFGLAVLSSAEISAESMAKLRVGHPSVELTSTGALLGTPSYMSPEQYAGERVDARTDQFSFAVALYDGLYGEKPFDGVTIEARRRSVVRGIVRGVSRDALARVPSALRRTLLRALRPHPDDRYPDMQALLDDLEEVAAARPWHERGRGRVLVLALAALVAGSSLLLARETVRRAPKDGLLEAGAAARPLAVGSRAGARIAALITGIENRTDNAALDGTVDAAIAAALYPSTRIDSYAGTELRALSQELESAPGTLEEDAGRRLADRDGRDVVFVRGRVTTRGLGFDLTLEAKSVGSVEPLFRGTESARDLSDVIPAAVRAGVALRAALGDAPAKGETDRVVLSPSVEAVHEWVVGHGLSAQGDYFGAVDHLKRALAKDPDFTEGHAALGIALDNLLLHAEAAREFEIVLRSADRLSERRRLTLLGDYYGSLGRYAESIAAYEQLLSKWPGDIGAEVSVAATAVEAASWPLAVELARRAVADHPRAVIARSNLVLAYMGNNSYAEAEHAGATMLTDFPNAPRYGFACLAMAQTLLGEPDRTVETFKRLAAVDPEFADETAADIALYQGRLDDARGLLQGQIDQALARNNPGDARTEFAALAELRMRRHDKVGALAAATATLGGTSPRLNYLVGRVFVQAGRPEAAIALARAWTESTAADERMYTKLIDGDVLRERGRLRDAIAAYQEAGRIRDGWFVHERLGAAYLALGAWGDAERELSACVERRGEIAVFATPSLHHLPAAHYALARAKEGGHRPDALATYQAFLALEPNAQNDPLADDARLRAAALEAASPHRP